MPYDDQLADKTAHDTLVRNPDVLRFIGECNYITAPSDDEASELARRFELTPSQAEAELPAQVVAIDGSRHESAFLERLPSTRVGYVQVSVVLIRLDEYGQLRTGRFVDPFRVAKLKSGQDPLAFPLPSSNVRWAGHATVRESFRAAVDHHLYSEATRFVPSDPRTSLRSTLFAIAAHRPELGTGDPTEIVLPKCPVCGAARIRLHDVRGDQRCPKCNGQVFPADALRLWEEVGEYTSNAAAITRFMNVVEHLLTVHYLRYLVDRGELDALESTAFIIDGPLALFGTVAPLHRGILSFIHEVNGRLAAAGRQGVLVLGLQKQGQLVEHAEVIDRFVPKDRILLVDDDYRYKHVICRDPADNGFGSETYYGQDFIYKTPSGRTFVFALPYPPGAKDAGPAHFIEAKSNRSNYPTLGRALAVISHFESDLYKNAIVPVALAHRYTAISLRPGGTVLDLLARKRLGQG
jgi:hypothetical protein